MSKDTPYLWLRRSANYHRRVRNDPAMARKFDEAADLLLEYQRFVTDLRQAILALPDSLIGETGDLAQRVRERMLADGMPGAADVVTYEAETVEEMPAGEGFDG